MKIDWPNERCIICLGTPREDDLMSQRTNAHVIPESVGGKLSAVFLCKRCNSRMGEAEAILPRDISVRLMLDQLEDQLPEELVVGIRYRQSYFADTAGYGRVEAGFDKQGELLPRQSEAIKDDENTLGQIAADLSRHGKGAEEIAAAQTSFHDAAPGEWIEVRPGHRVQKHIDWSEIGFKPKLNDPITPLHVPVGIAYLYLALCLGERVYDIELDPVRKALRTALDGDNSAADALCANRHGTRIVETKHLLRAKPDGGGTLVTLQIFRDLVWPVRFPIIVVKGEQTLYWVDVASGEESWATKLPEIITP